MFSNNLVANSLPFICGILKSEIIKEYLSELLEYDSVLRVD
ncbi:MAG TPA: hypothetical protein VFR65_01535 [Nitrososphaeraceae archaeon]|nr:hypothetical protein [Nitrososphaeraceae archaeon]